jgi:hypothetical protein
MAPPFMFDYLARLIIAPQPERANLAPRSSRPRAGLFLRGAGRSTPLGRPSGARCARESLSLAITREAEPRQPAQHHRPGGRLGDDAGAHDDFATVGKSTLPVHGRLTSAEDGPIMQTSVAPTLSATHWQSHRMNCWPGHLTSSKW